MACTGLASPAVALPRDGGLYVIAVDQSASIFTPPCSQSLLSVADTCVSGLTADMIMSQHSQYRGPQAKRFDRMANVSRMSVCSMRCRFKIFYEVQNQIYCEL